MPTLFWSLGYKKTDGIKFHFLSGHPGDSVGKVLFFHAILHVAFSSFFKNQPSSLSLAESDQSSRVPESKKFVEEQHVLGSN